jgi:hypothetical protein
MALELYQMNPSLQDVAHLREVSSLLEAL